MPPPKSRKVLSGEQKEILRRWVSEGAEWRDHWAFEPVVRPEPPAVKGTGRVRNEIDQFVLARLETEGLEPSEEADRRILIRRASLDLTGLPATPEEVEAFVRDESPGAYERVLDRLLASSSYGEHRARFWLDAARYGDTHGLHLDNYREIWSYRDWVIGAFNANMPFDDFTVEQLAGDLLADPSLSQRIATGFNRCNVTTSEGGSIDEEYAVRYAVDRVATTSTVWMGLTTECAVCHDHKYDPISQKEFFELFAYFNNTTQAPMDGNIEDTPPVVRIYETPEDELRERELRASIDGIEEKLRGLRSEAEAAFASWVEEISPEAARKDNHLDLAGRVFAAKAPELQATEGGFVELAGGQGIAFGKDLSFTVRLSFRNPEGKTGRWPLLTKVDSSGGGERGFRLVLENQSVSVELIERWPERALHLLAKRGYDAEAEREIFITYDGSGKAEGIMVFNDGKELGSRFNVIRADALEGDFGSEAPFLAAVPGAYEQEPGVKVSAFEVFDRQLSDEEILALSKEKSIPGLLAKAKAHLAEMKKGEIPGRADLLAHYLYDHFGEYAATMIERALLGTKLDQVLSRTATTLVMNEKDEDALAHILERGEYDKPGEEVRPGVP